MTLRLKFLYSIRKGAIIDLISLLAPSFHQLQNGGSIKFIFFFFCPIFLYSSRVAFITGESVNLPFLTGLSLPSRTQLIIPGS